jgi:hypothetical protein
LSIPFYKPLTVNYPVAKWSANNNPGIDIFPIIAACIMTFVCIIVSVVMHLIMYEDIYWVERKVLGFRRDGPFF